MNLSNRLFITALAVPALLVTILMLRVSVTPTQKAPLEAGNSTNIEMQQEERLPALSPPQIKATIVKPLQMAGAMRSMNVSIAFYGRVVSQDDNPIARAVVAIKVRQWHSLLTKGYAQHNQFKAVTSSDGSFSFTGLEGDVLGIEDIVKDGYVLSPQAIRSFNYTRGARANPDAPVIFRMRKQGPPQELVKGSRFLAFKADNQWYPLNLRPPSDGNEPPADSDLQVRIERPADIATEGQFPWRFECRVVNGGLIETNDEFMALAPENGYAKTFVQQMDLGESWVPFVRKKLFILTRGRVYGSVLFEVHPSYARDAALLVDYVINPSGSRSLE